LKTSSNSTVVLVQLGAKCNEQLLAKHLEYITEREFFKNIFLILESFHLNRLKQFGISKKIVVVTTRSLQNNYKIEFEDWRKKRRLPTAKAAFNSGFWYHVVDRFFYAYLLSRHANLDNLFVIETDYYLTPMFNVAPFEAGLFGEVALPFDHVKAIPGLCYFARSTSFEPFIYRSLANPLSNDMELFQAIKNNPASPLPTTPRISKRKLETSNLIFDAAAIGQYLYGIDSVAADVGGHPRGVKWFQNESSTITLSQDHLIPGFRDGYIQLYYLQDPDDPEEVSTVSSLHIHSKSTLPWVRRVFDIDKAVSTLSFQRLCDLHILLSKDEPGVDRTKKIPDGKMVLLPELDALGPLPRESRERFRIVTKHARRVFLGEGVLDFFLTYLASELENEIELVVENRNSLLDPHRLNLTRISRVKKIYAQNLKTCFGPFRAIPVGVSQQLLEGESASQLKHGSENSIKVFNLLSQDRLNEPESSIVGAARILIDKNSSEYHDYSPITNTRLELIRGHRFVDCTKNKSSLDCEMFWEAVYLKAIPVILREHLLPVYMEFSPFIIDSKAELLDEALLTRLYLERLVSGGLDHVPKVSDYFE
jgi:hypothetical protein